jgi:hypothetical protein
MAYGIDLGKGVVTSSQLIPLVVKALQSGIGESHGVGCDRPHHRTLHVHARQFYGSKCSAPRIVGDGGVMMKV